MNMELRKFLDVLMIDFDNRSVCENWTMYKSKMQQLAESFIPTVTFFESASTPWFNGTLKRLSTKKKILFRKAKTTERDSDWDKLYSADRQFRSAMRTQK